MSRRCPNCQEELAEDAKFCIPCGTHVLPPDGPLHPLDDPATETDEPPSHSYPELLDDDDEEDIEWTDWPDKESELSDNASHEEAAVPEKSPGDNTSPASVYDLAPIEENVTEEKHPRPSKDVAQPTQPRENKEPRENKAAQDTESAAVVYLYRLGRRTQQITRELSIIGAVCLLGWLIGNESFYRVVGNGVIVIGVIVALHLLLLEPIRTQCRQPIGAVRAYFQGLGRLLPEYRQMYSLLTPDSQKMPCFGSYCSFRDYWRYKTSQLKPEEFSHWPVSCSLRNCEVEYDDHRTRATVKCHLEICLWGRPQERLSVFSIRTELIKTPDNVWRIVDGRLPEPLPEL